MATPKESRRLVAGNWKMNLDHQAGCDLATAVVGALGDVALPVVFCAPAIHLHALHSITEGAANVHTGGQDISSFASGAHTGEISGSQLKSVGCSYVIIGHSERRADHQEAGKLLAAKVDQALENGLTPIYCFGETLDQREAGNEEKVVAAQLEEGLAHLDASAMNNVVLAYEPVWAIGTGVTASPAQAQAVHAFIRSWLSSRFGESLANSTSVLYGGSVKPANANELFNQPDIDGGLIGGASLTSDDFVAIVNAY